jgi:serine phosphatase RsbU (regulator of sigma subunit)
MNEVILATTGQTLLMTCLIVIINTAERRIRYANTGHNYPYLFRKCSSAAEMLESAQCFPLGFETKRLFEEKTIAFNPGDTLVLYSDGVNECSNGVEDYGYERFEKSLAGLAGFPPRVWVKNILQSLADFSGSAGFEDDVSLTVACFRNEAESGLVDVNSFLLNSCHGEFA